MKKAFLLLALLFIVPASFGTGEPSTYFNIFVPPNNDAVQRNVCLVITAIYDSTNYEIIDDNMDGDNDDSKSGVLMAGQSYILYIKDNGINDDAKYASGGVLRADGDYFIVRSNKLVYASQSTNSDWQHDWVPSINKSSLGTKFILYATQKSSSNRDINVFAYELNTNVTIRKVSTSNTLVSGMTHVNMDTINVVVQQQLNPGEDLIYKYTKGRDLLISGETYVVESDKPVTVQYGALYTNERDGGGYVPTSNGSSSGELMYFGVPYQAVGEQEIRIVSWSENNVVSLDRYSNGTWISMKSWTINKKGTADWVGKNNGNVSYPTVFRIQCSPGKKVSVFEGNWFETGSPGTSDMATMVSSENGTTAGNYFLTYMAPPGNEQNVRNPFTNTLFGQALTHVYVFAKDTAHVVIKDAYSNGTKLNRSYTILPGRYVDCFLTLAEWKNIYNGTGTTAGGAERPYLEITSDNPISVMNTNFNDNWMMYFGSAQGHTIEQSSNTNGSILIPGDTAIITSTIKVSTDVPGVNPTIQVIVGEGLDVLYSELTNSSTGNTYDGDIATTGKDTYVTFDSIPDLQTNVEYSIQTTVVAQPLDNSGNMIPNNSIQSIETTVSATFSESLDQSASSVGISNQSGVMSNYMFELFPGTTFDAAITNSWSISWVDYNKDNLEDLFFTEYNKTGTACLYQNNGNGTFTKVNAGALTSVKLIQTACSWADMDNDGDQDVLITAVGVNKILRNDNGTFVEINAGQITTENGYYHGAAWADYDNDGLLDVFISNYLPTRFNMLYKNNGNFNFEKIENGAFPMEAGMSTGATWCDYDNDGFADLFVPMGDPNGALKNDLLYHNEKNGTFTKVLNSPITTSGGNSVGSCWGDVDNDGDMDLFVANASNQNNFFFLNNGNGTFERNTTSIIANDNGNSHACNFADFDNDGDLDLYVSNDKGRKYLYLNNGQGEFTKNTEEIVTGLVGNTISSAICDYDRDGDLDIACATHSNQKNVVFQNIGNSNRWISIKLAGTASNKNGIGARLRIKCGNKEYTRQHHVQSGFGGQNSNRIHIGLGSSATIDSIVVLWPSGQQQILTAVPSNQQMSITEPMTGTVSGTLYFDRSENCALNEGEESISGIVLRFNPGNIMASSNADGTYVVSLPVGTYSMSVESELWNHSCNQTTVIVPSIGSLVTRNLALNALQQHGDLEVSISALAKRRGFTSEVLIDVANHGSEIIHQAALSIQLPSEVFVKGSSETFATFSANQASWMLLEIMPGERRVIHLIDSTGRNTPIGTPLQFVANISTNETELYLSNNSYSMELEAVGAIDPNELHVRSKRNGTGKFISINDTLYYKVLFQNVGNYSANSVTILDELPLELNLEYFHFIGSSHSCTSSINGRTLSVHFSNIELPDSNHNEPASHGFVEFAIRANESLSSGTTILNTADITFDYEDAIRTNEVSSTIKGNASENSLILYPNPASVETTAILNQNLDPSLESVKLVLLEIRDLKNQVLILEEVDGLTNIQIPLDTLINGVYCVLVTDENGIQHQSKLIVSNK